ncbi:uncharacterized protein CANTADRAFT_31997, partial [Suhomyces tanzawaensis NRRL Y-17324]
MLGRLFKQQSAQPHSGPSSTPPGQVNSSTFSSYEDPYTREILYGTHNPNQLKPYTFNNQLVRIIVSQDGGNLRSKQVLFDSANEPESPGSNSVFCKSPLASKHASHNRYMMMSKIHHNSSELNDYMFGCGLPTNQTHSSTKIHILPALNSLVYGSSRSVLITRLFSITDLDSSEPPGLSSIEGPSSSWNPTPTLPIKDSSIRNHPFAKMSNCQLASSPSSKPNNNINSRFAIGIIVPLESLYDIGDIVFNNWNELSHYLILLQRFTTKKLIHELNSGLMNNLNINDSPTSCPCPYIVNKRIQFPSSLLQSDPDLGNQVVKLIKLLHYTANVPKLMCANSLIRSCILSKSTSYNSILLNWVLEVINWLEFKDGKTVQPYTSSYNPLLQTGYNASLIAQSDSNSSSNNGNTFLASLLALIIPLRELLSTKPFYNVQGTKTRELTRIVIMTGNPVVAKKLIFIINALIPNHIFSFSISSSEFDDLNDNQNHNNHDDLTNTINEEIDTDDDNSSSRENLYSSKMNTGTKPIPIQTSKYSSSPSSSDNSLVGSTPSAKGWEIPRKARVSTTSIPKSKIETNAQIAPISVVSNSSKERQNSLSKSSSMSQLSSSLNSSLSNYSLTKFGGSFMEKWKNSFGSYTSNNSNPSNTFTNSHNTTGSSYNSSMMDSNEYFPPVYGGSLSKRNSIQSLRTPLPAIEQDEFTWHVNGSIINNTSGSNPINVSNGHASHSNGSILMTPTKLSRTQSMFDLYNMHSGHQNNPVREEKMNVVGFKNGPKNNLEIKRSKTGVYTPLINDNMVKNISEHNRDVIKLKCSEIMNMNVSLKYSDDDTLEAAPLSTFANLSQEFDDIDEFSIYKQKPLLPAVAFSDEFRSEFTVQSCPINPKLEAQVTTAMKNDLLFYQSNGGYEEIISRTVFISLRAREIKVIEMSFTD